MCANSAHAAKLRLTTAAFGEVLAIEKMYGGRHVITAFRDPRLPEEVVCVLPGTHVTLLKIPKGLRAQLHLQEIEYNVRFEQVGDDRFESADRLYFANNRMCHLFDIAGALAVVESLPGAPLKPKVQQKEKIELPIDPGSLSPTPVPQDIPTIRRKIRHVVVAICTAILGFLGSIGDTVLN